MEEILGMLIKELTRGRASSCRLQLLIAMPFPGPRLGQLIGHYLRLPLFINTLFGNVALGIFPRLLWQRLRCCCLRPLSSTCRRG